LLAVELGGSLPARRLGWDAESMNARMAIDEI
jgi:hypothetical protein